MEIVVVLFVVVIVVNDSACAALHVAKRHPVFIGPRSASFSLV